MAKDNYSALTTQLTEQLQTTGQPSLETLAELDRVRGNRARPYGFLEAWEFVPYRADTQVSRAEQERRALSAQGIIEPNEYDKRNAQAQAEAERQRQKDEQLFRERLKRDTEPTQRVIYPEPVKASTLSVDRT